MKKQSKRRKAARKNVWYPERGFFATRMTWDHALDPSSGRPVGGHHILVYCADYKGRIIMSPNYGPTARGNKREQEKWEWMCNTLLVVWWAYLPDPPPIKTMPRKRTLYYGTELATNTEWFNLTEQKHEDGCFCTRCKQWFKDIPHTHKCGRIKNAGPLCITTTPYA